MHHPARSQEDSAPMLFAPRQNRNMVEAGLAQLMLVYHQTVFNLRRTHSNAIVGLAMTILQSVMMVGAFVMLFLFMGVRSSPVRGDFMVFMMTGIFLYLTHIQTISAVAMSGRQAKAMAMHLPLTSAVAITAGALAVLYRQTLASLVILTVYYVFQPFTVEHPVGCIAMFLLAWASGAAIGLVVLAARPWAPEAITIVMTTFQRANMVFSGKMFLANTMPGFLMPMFAWNPLFHIIDQARGFAFVNYTPLRTSLTFPLYATLVITMLGLALEFVTRKHESASWSAGR